MTELCIPIRDTIHTEIDVQYNYVIGLSKERQESFPKENEEFVAELRKRGVPTVKVAIGREQNYVRLYDKEAPQVIAAKVREVQLYSFIPDQKLLVKGTQDMFCCQPLENHMAEQQKTHLIITGMTTKECVIFSLNSESRPPNTTFYGVYDLLADPQEPHPHDPMWHREYLENNLPDRPDIIYLTRQELLNALSHELKPAPPAKATPVHKPDRYTS